ncbi:MAG TPA: imidazole glycerol phosphate synthase subunit HisH, partial [Thermoguttaceae bacterium]|nr:imidazole glycerol phosphate synthase subunit HisH [Thermoguttaceae bacterium]
PAPNPQPRTPSPQPPLARLISIVDYGMGNLRSVQKGFEKVGHQAVVTSDPAVVAQAAKVVVPGVGAFEDAMAELRRRGLIEPILEAIHSDKPFLGICLGLQLLFERSYEYGEHEGLGVLAGEVVRFELPPEYSVPHMGWNQISIPRRPPILQGIPEGTHFYFVHSFYVVPKDEEVIATTTDYGGPFCSMIWRGNLFATQFHPEKSQSDGLRILKNFAELA